VRGDVVDVFPRNAHRFAAADPRGEATQPAGTPSPRARAAQDGNNLERLTWIAFERELVDVPATPPLRVEQLMIDEEQPKIDLSRAQFWPTFVRIISGIAVTAMITITTR
jgi:hypothetical protein